MKRFLFLLILVFIAVMIWLTVYEKEDDSPLPQKLERALRLTNMKTYHDDDYDYIIRYPEFFEQTEDSLLDRGSCRFSFWIDSMEIVQTAFVEPNLDSLSIEHGMQKYAEELSATEQVKGDFFYSLRYSPYRHLSNRRASILCQVRKAP